MAANSSSPGRMPDSTGSPTAQSRPLTRSPWTEVVVGGESEKSETVTAPVVPSSPQTRSTVQPALSDSTSDCLPASSSMVTEEEKSENAGKKPAWNRPSNGGTEGGTVMGAASWPALSESAKASSSKSSSDSLKSLSDGSTSSPTPVSQGIGTAGVSSVKHGNTANTNFIPNRQKSFNKRTGASSSGNGNLSKPLSQGSTAEMPMHSPSSRVHNQRNGVVSQSQGGNENQPLRSRNQNGYHHQNHGGRRNHEHGGTQWNPNRNMNGRDGNIHSRRGVSGIIRQPPPISVPYRHPQPMQAFVSPVGLHEMASPLYYGPPPGLGGVPFVQPIPSPVFYQVEDSLPFRIVKQIDFYFSDENLIKDIFLRQNMDDQGYVPIKLVAGFKKVSGLTDDIQLIINSLRGSAVVEIQGDKIRRRNGWMNWLIPHTVHLPSVSSPQSRERSDQNLLTTQVQNFSLQQNMRIQSVSAQLGDAQPQASISCSMLDSDGQPQQLNDKAGTSSPSGSY